MCGAKGDTWLLFRSLSGKSKSKKKSRRKKTSNPQPQITQREQQQLIANHDANGMFLLFPHISVIDLKVFVTMVKIFFLNFLYRSITKNF